MSEEIEAFGFARSLSKRGLTGTKRKSRSEFSEMVVKSRSDFSEMVVKSRSEFSEKRQNRLVPSRLLWRDKTHPHQGFQPWHERRGFDDSPLSCFVFAPPFIDLADRLRRAPRDFPIAKARTDGKTSNCFKENLHFKINVDIR